MESIASRRRRALLIFRALCKEYPRSTCRLTFATPLQLLIKTILSAQCTDERVNAVGDVLFRAYPTVQRLAAADEDHLASVIRPAGFHRTKARNIRSCCTLLLERWHGEVPRTMNELLLLPGVGRKTANVVLGNVFHVPGLAVDTHVGRIAGRLQLTDHHEPEGIEKDLVDIIPSSHWVSFSHMTGDHGRQTCMARRPLCHQCVITRHCPSSLV